MALSFKPKSENELRESQLADPGEYDFDVLEASEEISKTSGNPMIKVKLGIYHGETVRWHVYDYLMPSMESKLRHFCDTTGLLKHYEAGTLVAEDCRWRGGRCKLIKDTKNPNFPPKNVVRDYVCRPAKPLPASVKADNQFDDDPFA